QLTHESIANKGAFNPSWSNDAKQIVYSRKYQFRQSNKLADMQKIWDGIAELRADNAWMRKTIAKYQKE
ncbi:MAG TPA: hypothetical protein PKU92_12675, partial [Agitococcus sp.]|nr:hypothetical protein [Agitococcus sp.]